MIKKILTIISSVSVCCSCTSQNDEEMIRSLIRNGAELAEEKQIGDLMKLTGDGFTALPGSYDAVSVKGVLFRAFLHYGVFNILYPTPSVELRFSGWRGLGHGLFSHRAAEPGHAGTQGVGRRPGAVAGNRRKKGGSLPARTAIEKDRIALAGLQGASCGIQRDRVLIRLDRTKEMTSKAVMP
jgi:hypothetical protein